MSWLNGDGLSQLLTLIKEHIPTSQGDLTPLYGECTTAAETAAKTVSISGVTELVEGLTIYVRFTYANGVASPTLQVNSLTAKAIKRYGTTAPSTSAASSWNAGAVVSLTYDGTYWMLNDWINTTYSAMTEAEMQTGTATTARNLTVARLKAAVKYHAPVTSVNGSTGAVTVTVPTAVSALTNDSGYQTASQVQTAIQNYVNSLDATEVSY